MQPSREEQRALDARFRELRGDYSRRWLGAYLLALLPLAVAAALLQEERAGAVLAIFAGLFAAGIGFSRVLAARRARREVAAESGRADYRPPQGMLD